MTDYLNLPVQKLKTSSDMKGIDLHIHPSYSDDGELSPKELLYIGKQAGLSYLSITDHNCVHGERNLLYKELRIIGSAKKDYSKHDIQLTWLV